jgi:hypothetical protein
LKATTFLSQPEKDSEPPTRLENAPKSEQTIQMRDESTPRHKQTKENLLVRHQTFITVLFGASFTRVLLILVVLAHNYNRSREGKSSELRLGPIFVLADDLLC